MKIVNYAFKPFIVIGIIVCMHMESFCVIGGDGNNYTVSTTFHNLNRITKINLTFSVTGHVNDVTQSQMDMIAQKACGAWMSRCNLSFKKVAAGADLTFTLEDHCTWDGNAYGSGSGNANGGSIKFYEKKDYGATDPNYSENDLLAILTHEMGHVLGMKDLCWSAVAYIDHQNGTRKTVDFLDPNGDYGNWRLSFCGQGAAHEWYKDTHISMMDYDAGYDTRWNASGTGRCYLSAYDVEFAKTVYGMPTEYKPIIVMQLGTANPVGKTNYDNVSFYSGAYVTSSWDSANCVCKAYASINGVSPDVRYWGIVSMTSGTGKVKYYRYYNSTTHDYCVSTATSKSGWIRLEDLGYWWTSSGDKTLTVAGQSAIFHTIPQYQYNKAAANGIPAYHYVTSTAFTNNWNGYTYCTGDETVNPAYIINSTNWVIP